MKREGTYYSRPSKEQKYSIFKVEYFYSIRIFASLCLRIIIPEIPILSAGKDAGFFNYIAFGQIPKAHATTRPDSSGFVVSGNNHNFSVCATLTLSSAYRSRVNSSGFYFCWLFLLHHVVRDISRNQTPPSTRPSSKKTGCSKKPWKPADRRLKDW